MHRIWMMGGMLGLIAMVSACVGAESVTKKRWDNKETTLRLQDLTPNRSNYREAGYQLGQAMEDQLSDSVFILSEDQASYLLKYKVVEFQRGSRLKRMATLGIDEGAHGKLKVKVALYNQSGLLGAWEINSWVNGGPVGGSEGLLYKKAAKEILLHLKGY